MKRVRTRRVAAALAATLLAGGLATWATAPGDTDTSSVLVTAPVPSSGPARTPAAAGPLETPTPLIPQPTGTTSRPVPAPTSLEIPAVKVRMPLTSVTLDARGDMELPQSPDVAGWYRYGPAPGSEAGAAVIAAHVDTPKEGVGPLAVLDELEPGTEVVVRSGRVVTRYVIESVRTIDKGGLDLRALFARDGPPRLHLVTCGGEFDRRTRQYADNVVAVAVPVR